MDYADIMICPSREDPMPTVAAEAMMHGVPCIVSDVTGTAEYIENGMNGFVFHTEDARELSDKIAWFVLNNEKICNMGTNARLTYERIFSMNVFEMQILRLINCFK